jgi:chaperonin GroES
MADRVLLERAEEAKKVGSILIAATFAEKPNEATVVAVGPGARTKDGALIPMTLKVGEKVIFPATSATDITIDGKALVVIKESDIYCVVE